MNKKNEFHEKNLPWSLEEWTRRAGGMNHYRVVGQDELPEFLSDGLTAKINSAVYAVSAGDVYIFATVHLFRVDDKKVKGLPYVAVFDGESRKFLVGGDILHASYPGRDQDISPDDIQRLSLCGTEVNIQIDNKPKQISGTLECLSKSGLLRPFENSVSVIIRKIKNDV